MAKGNPDEGLYAVIDKGQKANAILTSSPNLRGPLGSVEKLLKLIANVSPGDSQSLEEDIDALVERWVNPDYALSYSSRQHVDYRLISKKVQSTGRIENPWFALIAYDLLQKVGFITPKLMKKALGLPRMYSIPKLMAAYAENMDLTGEKLSSGEVAYYRKGDRPDYLAVADTYKPTTRLLKQRLATIGKVPNGG